MAEEATPGVTTPPVEPAATAVPAPTEPTGNEPVTNTGKEEQSVPFTRFQEVNDKAKASEERAVKAEQEAEELRQSQVSQNGDDELDPDVLELVKKSSAKLGLVSKEELDAREAGIQVKQDINELTSQYKDSGIAFDGKKVIDYAKANGMPLGSKKSLDAVYKEMNYDAIIEAQRKAAVTSFQEGNKSGAEKSGSSGTKSPEEPKAGSLKDRIKAAREKSGFNIA